MCATFLKRIISKFSFAPAVFLLQIFFVTLIIFNPLSLKAQTDTSGNIKYSSDIKYEGSPDANIFLMISSFNPDTKRTQDFITNFEAGIKKLYKKNYLILVEELGAKNFTEEAHLWKGRVAKLLSKYKGKNVKAVIAIGQEAWSAISSQDTLTKEYPFLGAFISANGVDLPEGPIDETWSPDWVNMSRKMRKKAIAGGVFNQYVPSKNIELALSFYPDSKTIVFLTDNTYGGVSLKTYIKKGMNSYPHNIKYIFLDSRELYFPHMKEIVSKLPSNSLIIIGTWRVNRDGQYYMGNSLEELMSGNPDIPVFTITGSGLGSGAIGGYIPNYSNDAGAVVEQIDHFYSGRVDSICFVPTGSNYQFDQKKLDKLTLKKYQLPQNSVIINGQDPRIEKYRTYLIIISAITFILAISIVAFSILYRRNLKLRLSLEENTIQLKEAKERAEESDRLKSAFLANMSHEIRTPLNAIVGFSNLMTEEEFSVKERQEMSKVITQNSKLLLTLITDILDFSGLETGKLNFIFKEIEINSLCEQVMATTAHIRKEGVEYRFVPGERSLLLRTDSHRLSQVLLNLLTNANKFTDSGSIVLSYEVIPSEGKIRKADNSGYTTDCILFSVTDTGQGIQKDQHKLLFERFGKLNSFKQGAGLGLAISKQIVGRFGGKIWIDSDYEGGARFMFTHPL